MPGYFSALGTSGSPIAVAPAKSAAATATAVNITNASSAVLAANASRKKMYLVNDSDTDMWVTFGTPALANSGIRINALGGSIMDDIYTGIVTAIHAGGAVNKVLTVTEE